MLTLTRDMLLLITAGVALVVLAFTVRLIQLAMRVLDSLGHVEDWWPDL